MHYKPPHLRHADIKLPDERRSFKTPAESGFLAPQTLPLPFTVDRATTWPWPAAEVAAVADVTHSSVRELIEMKVPEGAKTMSRSAAATMVFALLLSNVNCTSRPPVEFPETEALPTAGMIAEATKKTVEMPLEAMRRRAMECLDILLHKSPFYSQIMSNGKADSGKYNYQNYRWNDAEYQRRWETFVVNNPEALKAWTEWKSFASHPDPQVQATAREAMAEFSNQNPELEFYHVAILQGGMDINGVDFLLGKGATAEQLLSLRERYKGITKGKFGFFMPGHKENENFFFNVPDHYPQDFAIDARLVLSKKEAWVRVQITNEHYKGDWDQDPDYLKFDSGLIKLDPKKPFADQVKGHVNAVLAHEPSLAKKMRYKPYEIKAPTAPLFPENKRAILTPDQASQMSKGLVRYKDIVLQLELGKFTPAKVDALLMNMSSGNISRQTQFTMWEFAGTPFEYESQMAVPPEGQMRVRMNSFGCIGFVMTILALNNAKNFYEFVDNLRHIRYLDSDKRGVNNDPTHGNIFDFAEEVIYDSLIPQGFMRDITQEVAGDAGVTDYTVRLAPIRRPKEMDPRQTLVTAKKRPNEIVHVPMIHFSDLKNVDFTEIRQGDVVAFSKLDPRKPVRDGTVFHHIGFVQMRPNGEPYILNAARDYAWVPDATGETKPHFSGRYFNNDPRMEQLGVSISRKSAKGAPLIRANNIKHYGYQVFNERTMNEYMKGTGMTGVAIYRPTHTQEYNQKYPHDLTAEEIREIEAQKRSFKTLKPHRPRNPENASLRRARKKPPPKARMNK